MDIFMARDKVRELTKEIIESIPGADPMILADQLIDALVGVINEHIEDPDDQVVYDIY